MGGLVVALSVVAQYISSVETVTSLERMIFYFFFGGVGIDVGELG